MGWLQRLFGQGEPANGDRQRTPARKTAIGPDSSLKDYPLLYLYFDDFAEIRRAWQAGTIEAARHDADSRSSRYSVEKIMNDEDAFLRLYADNLVRVMLPDGTQLRRDSEMKYWDQALHPAEHRFVTPTHPDLSEEMKQGIQRELERLNAVVADTVHAIKKRYPPSTFSH